mgnify:CR=1 FL=1
MGMHTARRPAPIGVSELPALSAVVFAIAAIVAVFLPWYLPNLAGPLELDPASGWSATSLGKGTLVVAVIWLVAAGLSLMEQVSPGRLDRSTLNLMGWLVTGCALLCTLMTVYRFLRPPPPADFLTRDYGLFIAIAASVAGVGAGLAMTHGRRPRTRASARRRALRGA